MLREERHQRIRALVGTNGGTTTERIAADLGVSRETVRRDCVELEAMGELKRVHGGVVAVAPEAEPPLAVRSQVRLREKRAIAKSSARLVEAGWTLYLDFGSTVSLLAEELASLPGLSVLTNSFDVARTISAGGRSTADLLGGRVEGGIPATFGAATIAEIYRRRADIALLSPTALDVRHGATSFDPAEAEVARAMVENADRVVILADATKIGKAARVSFCPTDRIDAIVTDAEARALPGLAELERLVTRVLVA